ncbi:hypothetical protein AAVH_22287 [Aphelenchoides avenae]|nr:hypothetical protein AAVH_22287 [Aphelenchus avenae]
MTKWLHDLPPVCAGPVVGAAHHCSGTPQSMGSGRKWLPSERLFDLTTVRFAPRATLNHVRFYIPMRYSVYVGNVPRNREIEALFEQANDDKGTVLEVR